METKLTWGEIRQRYDQEWVLLDDCDWPEEEIDPRSGIVRLHARTREEFDRLIAEKAGPFDSAIVFVGEPEGCADIVVTRGYNRVEFGN